MIESFLNDETNPVSDWLATKVLDFCLVGRLSGLTVRTDPLLEDLRTNDFLGDAKGNR